VIGKERFDPKDIAGLSNMEDMLSTFDPGLVNLDLSRLYTIETAHGRAFVIEDLFFLIVFGMFEAV
jgi:hypothetical protein